MFEIRTNGEKGALLVVVENRKVSSVTVELMFGAPCVAENSCGPLVSRCFG